MRNSWFCRVTISRWLWLVLIVCLFRSATPVQAQASYAGWTPGQAVPLGVEAGPLGATREYEVTPLGTANVFGNGPYDLFLKDRKLLPFIRFMPNGAPLYGQPREFTAPATNGSILTDSESVIWGVFLAGESIKTAKFDPSSLKFETVNQESVRLPGGARSFTSTLSPGGRLLTFYSVPDGQPYHPVGPHHHKPEYQPFSGSGIWRGGLPYAGLGSAMFINGTNLGRSAVKYPQFRPGRDFLFGSPGMTILNLGPERKGRLLAATKLGVFYYFRNRAGNAINLDPGVFISDKHGNAIRHPGINPKPTAIPDPETGLSDLLVGDTGLMWFYNFTGRFNSLGGPIYDTPVRAFIQSPRLVLSALPVITSGDLDGDDLTDLVAGNDVGDIYFIRNVGSETAPQFDIPQSIVAGGEVLKVIAGYGTNQGPGEARWGYTCPTVYDWNSDGHPDIIYNSIHADITLLLQIPGTNPPAFEKPVILSNDGLELRLVWRTQPAVTDWGAPGQACIVVNDEENVLRRFWRIDDYNVRRGEPLRLTTGEPIQTHSRREAGQLGRTKIQAVDWDQDGHIDLLTGTGRSASIPGKGGIPDDTFKGDARQASVLFLRNAGTNEKPVFEYPKLIHHNGKKIEMGAHSCSPLAIDLGRGQLDLLVGMEQGVVIYYPRDELTWPEKTSSAGQAK